MTIWPAGAFLLAQETASVDKEFLSWVSESNLTEIAISQIAQQRTQYPAICIFADSMEEDFQIAQRDLERIAQQEGIPIKDTPDIRFQRWNFGIGALSGKKFDSAYENMQLLDHQIAIRWLETEEHLGNDSLCRAYAARYLPKLRHYLLMARDLWTKPPPDGRPASEPDEHWPYQ
jgi:putative membrane protein